MAERRRSVASAGRGAAPVTLTWFKHQGPGKVTFEPAVGSRRRGRRAGGDERDVQRAGRLHRARARQRRLGRRQRGARAVLLDERVRQNHGHCAEVWRNDMAGARMFRRVRCDRHDRLQCVGACRGCRRPEATRLSANVPEPVTFTKDVAPILQQKCQVCHQPNSIAPMSLITYEEARKFATSRSRRASRARVMPPWHIDKNVGIREFKNDRSLTDAEIDTIVELGGRRRAAGRSQGSCRRPSSSRIRPAGSSPNRFRPARSRDQVAAVHARRRARRTSGSGRSARPA